MSGAVASIQTCPGKRRPMVPLDEVTLEPGGIPGDAHFSPGSTRQVLLIESETLSELGIGPGAVKEQITTSGIALMGLPLGTRITIGDAELEVTKECHPCSRMDEVRAGLQAELEGRRGMMARVVGPGRVRRGDPITIVGARRRAS